MNIHGSLLPRYRGAAPVQRCIMEGDEETGVTLMYMAEGMDTGDMIASAKTEVGRKNAGELLEELSALGYNFISSEVEQVPSTYITLEGEDDIKHMNLLLENLEENEDVQNVYHNWENCD